MLPVQLAEVNFNVADITAASLGNMVEALWGDLGAYIRGNGFCHKRGSTASMPNRQTSGGVWHPSRRAHVYCNGPPCQPYSPMSGLNARQSCEEHPLFSVLFGESQEPSRSSSVLDVLRSTLPHSAIIEEVTQFAELDKQAGYVPFRRFLKHVELFTDPYNENRRHFTHVCVFFKDPGRFLSMNRPRIDELLRVHEQLKASCKAAIAEHLQHTSTRGSLAVHVLHRMYVVLLSEYAGGAAGKEQVEAVMAEPTRTLVLVDDGVREVHLATPSQYQ
jgi:hypothetical protein